MSQDYLDAIASLEKLKRRYDEYAGELMRLKQQSPIFHGHDDLLVNRICNCLTIESCNVSSFPWQSHKFSSLMLVTCRRCGAAFVPSLNFDLSEYYSKDYARLVQPFRIVEHTFYSDENPFFKSDTYSRFKKRAQMMLQAAGDSPEKSLLDFGAGVGVMCSLSASRKKFAIEKDPNSLRILKEELGVQCVELEDFNKKVDLIVSSHVLEHLQSSELIDTIRRLLKVLSKDGKMVFCVPDGANQVALLRNGTRSGLFEPHLLYFSLQSFFDLGDKLDLEVTHISKANSIARFSENYDSDVLDKAVRLDTNELCVVFKRRSFK